MAWVIISRALIVCQELDTSSDLPTRYSTWKQNLQLLQNCFDLIDENHDGFISFEEFRTAFIQTKVVTKASRMRQMFERMAQAEFPGSKEEKITVRALMTVLGKSEEEAKRLIEQADRNCDDTIDYEEFLNMWHLTQEKRSARDTMQRNGSVKVLQ